MAGLTEGEDELIEGGSVGEAGSWESEEGKPHPHRHTQRDRQESTRNTEEGANTSTGQSKG